jgi:formylglycine-generating enzyme required for sulfatase activity
MIEIPAITTTMNTTFRVRETGYYESMDSSFINAVYPRLHHSITKPKHIALNRYALDETPVTNKQFKMFLDATGYSPAIKESFLKHWVNGEIPAGRENYPVVFVDLNDAGAYAAWAGKRLPSEDEWQFAAQGESKYKYPWGNVFDAGKCNSNGNGDLKSVYEYLDGRSPFGCYDMCGNVWELTESEYTDGHTRFCILKGGSSYKAQGSDWYFIGGAQACDFAAKQILIYPGLDRCATIGFRCAVDLK